MAQLILEMKRRRGCAISPMAMTRLALWAGTGRRQSPVAGGEEEEAQFVNTTHHFDLRPSESRYAFIFGYS